MEPSSWVLLIACGVLVVYAGWRALDRARHNVAVTDAGLRWRIDPQRMHARVRALPEHRAAGGERSYELRRTQTGTWEMRLTDTSRWRMLDGAGRELHAASDKQRLEI